MPVLLIVNVPVPRAAAALTLTVPLLSVKPPVEKVLAPPRVRVPAPALVRLKAPLMIPPTCRVLALTVTVRLAFNVTAPVPRLSEFVPVKVKLLLQAWTLFVSSDWAIPLVLSRVAAPLIVNVPVPRAELVVVEPPLLIWRVLVPVTVMPPERVLKPPSFKVPAPATVSRPLPESTPCAGLAALTARVCPASVIVQDCATPSASGALMVVVVGAPVAILMPLDPRVRTPKAP